MSLTMYQASVPVFVKGFKNLSAILDKAAAHATEKKIEPAVFINDRLAPDMFPLSRQIQIATDITKGGVARLADIEVPSFEDTEATFADLQARIKKTVDFIQTVKEKQFEGSETRDITLKSPRGDMHFKGKDYLLSFVLPNFYFHITAAYAILRHNGVGIGKADFLGAA